MQKIVSCFCKWHSLFAIESTLSSGHFLVGPSVHPPLFPTHSALQPQLHLRFRLLEFRPEFLVDDLDAAVGELIKDDLEALEGSSFGNDGYQLLRQLKRRQQQRLEGERGNQA